MSKFHPMYTRRSLVISTAHVPLATDVALHQDDAEVIQLPDEAIGWHLGYYAEDNGWSIYVSDNQIEVAKQCGHPELAALLALAYQNDFDYLVLSCDAPKLPESFGLPTFDW